jgi:hypothetical protein
VSLPLDFAVALTGAWVAVYTRGLQSDARAERREEIDCDLWEQKQMADLGHETATGTAAHVLFRLVLGMPADIAWRIETGFATKRRKSVNQTWPMRIGLLLSSFPLAGFLLANGISMLIGAGEYDDRNQQVLWGVVLSVIPIVMITGLWLCASMPRLGLGLLIAGIIATWVIFYWMLIVTVPIGIAVIAFAVKRSGISLWPLKASSGGPTGTA